MISKTKVNTLFFLLLLVGTIFASTSCFVNSSLQIKNYIYAIIVLIWVISLAFYKEKERMKRIDMLTIVLVFFVLFLIIRSGNEQSAMRIIFLTCFVFFYLIGRGLSRKDRQIMDIMIALVCFLLAIYGLLQYIGITHSPTQYRVSGNFDNPAGIAACLSAGIFFSFRLIKSSTLKIKFFGYTIFFVILLAVILSNSRAGVISIILVLLTYAFFKYWRSINFKRKILLFFTSAAFIIFLSIFLFSVKKESAIGRVLIWKSTMIVISDNPFFGGGTGSFKKNYMLSQAKYFRHNPASKFGILADNVIHPFNEYLFLTTEYGILGLTLLAFIIFIALLYNKKKLTIYHLSLLSILLFSLFAYPFRYSIVWILVAYNLSQLSHHLPSVALRKRTYLSVRIAKILIIALCVFLLYSVFVDVRFEYKWNKLAKNSISENRETELLTAYLNLYNNWNGNPLFLYNYGAELNYNKKYNESLFILQQCEKFYNDYDVQLIIADNYFNIDSFCLAEKHYILASQMIPGRFTPLYKLMSIYEQKDEIPKMLNIAHEIVNKDVKIPSSTISFIKRQASKNLSTYEAYN